MERLDPITASTPDWEAFVASLSPERLEQERFGHPSPAERPGSPEWKRMVRDNDKLRRRYYDPGEATATREGIAAIMREATELEGRYRRHFQTPIAAMSTTTTNQETAA